MKLGGGISVIIFRVPLRDPRAVALANERAALRRKARELNVMANTLPEWAAMRAREDVLKAETGLAE